ncbi:MAG: S-layer homology domain-containing protein, partial [Alicyclobacillaceae bacterium]|nr:S-layer homology domain-containing protein [Alicyclobacillaceae bacterium]
ILVQTPLGVYSLPVGAVDAGAGGGVEVVVRLPDQAQLPLDGLVGQHGATLIGNPVAFEVYKWNGQGKTAVEDFGHLYVRRLIPLGQVDAGPEKTGVFAYDPNRRTWVPVPARFVKGAGGTVSALVSQPANRVYAVVNRTRTFEDLRNHWAAAQVGKLVARGVLNGVDASHFAPDALVTRGQFAVMLARALGIDDKVARQAAFADVPAGGWNRHEVDVVAQEGLMSGVSSTWFAEGDPMTREQMIAVLGRAMRYVDGHIPPGDPGALAKFADRSAVSGWAVSDVATMVQAGVVVGTDGKLEPGRPATRAEAATMLGKMLAALGLTD